MQVDCVQGAKPEHDGPFFDQPPHHCKKHSHTNCYSINYFCDTISYNVTICHIQCVFFLSIYYLLLSNILNLDIYKKSYDVICKCILAL